jgi:hypothetical protein
MVEKVITPDRNVIDFARYQAGRNAAGKAPAIPARACRHCGAALSEGESEDECSSAFNFRGAAPGRRPAQILRGLNPRVIPGRAFLRTHRNDD